MAVMMALGPFRFSIETAAYQTLERHDEYRWEPLDRIGRHPAMQFLGPGVTSVVLPGVVYPHWRGGGNQIQAMRAVAGTGAPHQLVSGYGRIFGPFVVLAIDETESFHFKDGAPRKQEFTIELASYGQDGGSLVGFASRVLR